MLGIWSWFKKLPNIFTSSFSSPKFFEMQIFGPWTQILLERSHSEMKMLSIMRFTLLIMPIAFMDALMQVHGWCDAFSRMLRCRSPDVQILEMETLPGKVRALLGKINVEYVGNNSAPQKILFLSGPSL